MSTNIRTLIAECVSTFLLVFLAVGAAVVAVGAKVGLAGPTPGTTVIASVLAGALVLLGVLVAVGPLARTHLTPAVTFALARRRTVSVDMAVDSWIGQVIGAILAGVALYFFIPWATGLDGSSDAGTTINLTVQDVLIAGLLSVLLLVAPMIGVAVIAVFSTPDRLLIGAPAPVAHPTSPPRPEPMAVFVPQPDIAQDVEPEALPEPELDVEPMLEPVTALGPVSAPVPTPPNAPDVADEPEPELDPELEPIESPEPLVAEVARPVVFAAAESATSWPSPPRATFATPRATPSATRVVAPFPPAPTPSPFPLRREVAPARGSSAFVSTLAKKDEPAKAKSQDKHKNKKNSKDEKAAKAKKGNKHKSKSTVTVQVKVTDKQRKHKKNRKK